MAPKPPRSVCNTCPVHRAPDRWQFLDSDDVIRGPYSLMQLIDVELRGHWDYLVEDASGAMMYWVFDDVL